MDVVTSGTVPVQNVGQFVMFERGSTHLIEKDEIYVLTPEEHQVGPFGPMHRGCKNPYGEDALIIGFNPIIYTYRGHDKAWCAYCHCFASDECQEWLDSGCQK